MTFSVTLLPKITLIIVRTNHKPNNIRAQSGRNAISDSANGDNSAKRHIMPMMEKALAGVSNPIITAIPAPTISKG